MSASQTDLRRHHRLEIKIPIVVNGLDKDGQAFTEPTVTLNGSVGGIGFQLQHEPGLAARLTISIFHNLRLFHIRAEVRHVTPANGKKTVGVKFRGIGNNLSSR